jgi:hypothetical protein
MRYQLVCVHWFVKLPEVGCGWGSTSMVQSRPFSAVLEEGQ